MLIDQHPMVPKSGLGSNRFTSPNSRYARPFLLCVMLASSGCKTGWGGGSPSAAPNAPQQLKLDLASAKATDSLLISEGRYTVAIFSKAPKYRYTVTASQHSIQIPPINSAALGPFFQSRLDSTSKCGDLPTAMENLTTASEEDKIAGLVAAVRKAVANAVGACNQAEATALADATTYVRPDVYNVLKGTYLRIDVLRQDSAAASQRNWTMTYTTGSRGEWAATFGYAFPYVSGPKGGFFAAQRTYFAKDDGAGKFVITRDARQHQFAMVPVVLFNFLPEDAGWLTPGFTGGLGLDPADPSALGAFSLAHYANLQLSLGFAFRQEDRLLGKYNEGDIVTTDLSSSQLHDKDWRFRPFISLTFRFNSNPFKATATSAGTDAKPEPQTPKQ